MKLTNPVYVWSTSLCDSKFFFRAFGLKTFTKITQDKNQIGVSYLGKAGILQIWKTSASHHTDEYFPLSFSFPSMKRKFVVSSS